MREQELAAAGAEAGGPAADGAQGGEILLDDLGAHRPAAAPADGPRLAVDRPRPPLGGERVPLPAGEPAEIERGPEEPFPHLAHPVVLAPRDGRLVGASVPVVEGEHAGHGWRLGRGAAGRGEQFASQPPPLADGAGAVAVPQAPAPLAPLPSPQVRIVHGGVHDAVLALEDPHGVRVGAERGAPPAARPTVRALSGHVNLILCRPSAGEPSRDRRQAR